MAFIRRRRRHSSAGQLSKFLHSLPYGLVYLGVGTGLLGAVAAFGNSISNYLNLKIAIGSTTVTLPLGTITNVTIAFSGLLALIYGVHKLLRIRL